MISLSRLPDLLLVTESGASSLTSGIVVMSPDLVTVSEAARLSAVTEREVFQLVTNGTLTQYRRGRETTIDLTEVQRLGGR